MAKMFKKSIKTQNLENHFETMIYNICIKRSQILNMNYTNVQMMKIHKRDLRIKLKIARYDFDKHYRREERQFKRTQAAELGSFCTADPNTFWSKLKSLGPKQRRNIPREVYDHDKR